MSVNPKIVPSPFPYFGGKSRMTRAVTTRHGLTAVFMDPPYSHKMRDFWHLYAADNDCGAEVSEWCISNGHHEKLRIVLCGYQGEHEKLLKHGWSVYSWKAPGGYGSQGNKKGRQNCMKERLWISPNCLNRRR